MNGTKKVQVAFWAVILVSVQFFIHQYLQALLHLAALNPFITQSAWMFEVALTKLKHLTLSPWTSWDLHRPTSQACSGPSGGISSRWSVNCTTQLGLSTVLLVFHVSNKDMKQYQSRNDPWETPLITSFRQDIYNIKILSQIHTPLSRTEKLLLTTAIGLESFWNWNWLYMTPECTAIIQNPTWTKITIWEQHACDNSGAKIQQISRAINWGIAMMFLHYLSLGLYMKCLQKLNNLMF